MRRHPRGRDGGDQFQSIWTIESAPWSSLHAVLVVHRFPSVANGELKFTQGRTTELFPVLHILGEEFLRSSLTPAFDPTVLAESPCDRSDAGGARTDQSHPVAIGKRYNAPD